ncbi:replication protein [Thermodesulfobacteriota bacterium]
MANPQLENGYTRVANELLEALAKIDLTASEVKILFVIIRKTYGFNKKKDRISYSQFEEKTGMRNGNMSRPIKRLEEKNIIIVRRKSGVGSFYGIQKDYERWSTTLTLEGSLNAQPPSKRKATTRTPEGKTTLTPEGYKRKKENTKRKYSEKLSSKESLEAYFSSLNELTFTFESKEQVILFLNKIRLTNKTKSLSTSRADKMLSSLSVISEKFTEKNMLAGIEAVFKKEERGGFHYGGHNPTGYVMAVAKSLSTQNHQRDIERKAREEKEQLRKIPSGNLFKKIENELCI